MPKGMQDDRIENRLRQKIEGLYGNEAITGDMDDSTAQVFLKWAEDRVRKIVDSTSDLDDDAAEEQMYPRMKAIRRIARYINRAVRDPEGNPDLVDNILQQARVMYGESFTEPDRQKLQALLTGRTAPADLIQTLKYFLEGEVHGTEEEDQQQL